jgi:hypothetical protein
MTATAVDVSTFPDGTLVIHPCGALDAADAVELRRTLVQKSNPPTSTVRCRRFCGNWQLFRIGWQVPHLIECGHMPGHSLD